jgi:signal transduction histidine kinase
MRISDDGCGFDLGGVGAEHLGLKIMSERAAEIGAAFYIESAAGQGTAVTVRWADPTPKER